MSDILGAQPPGAGGPPKPPGAAKPSILGGPSGPGGSPMTSPGTGAGMQARGMQRVQRIINELMDIGKSFEGGTPQFNGVVGAIKSLNAVFKAAPAPETPKAPLPMPAASPAKPPGIGMPTPGPPGGAPGGASPMAPGME